MQGNDLSSLPDGVFDDLTNLHTLALYDNDLTALPDGVFDGLTKLRTLAISGNKLTALSGDVFTGLGGLASLVASNNKLTSLPDGVFSWYVEAANGELFGQPERAVHFDWQNWKGRAKTGLWSRLRRARRSP